MYIRELDYAERSHSSIIGKAVSANGVTYPNGVRQTVSLCRDVAYVDFGLSRDFDQFQATLSVPDDQRAEGQTLATVFVDNVEVLSQVMQLGNSYPIDLDVSGALRLRLQVTRLEEAFCAIDLAYGDARLVR